MTRTLAWKVWIGPLVIAIYLLLLFIALPLMILEFQGHDVTVITQTCFVGGLFVLLALPVSLWTILQHLVHYTQPHLQRHIIRILWMVPIYAINSWFALRFQHAGLYLDTARECYEAYVILNFMSYLTNFLKIDHPFLESHLATKPQVKHLPPICCLTPWAMGRQLISRCRHGVLQYTVLRIVTTIIAFVSAMISEEFYGEGDFNFKSVWSYLVIINNISQVYAMYCLIMFYKATREELHPVKPVAKFLCVKFVVFLSFWQSLLITGLVNSNVIQLKTLTNPEAANAIQDVCICVEMLFAAVAHYVSFPYEPFVDVSNVSEQKSCFDSFKLMWDVSDVRRDLADHISHVGSSATNMIRGEVRNGRPSGNEELPLLDNQATHEPNEYISMATIAGDDDYVSVATYAVKQSTGCCQIIESSDTSDAATGEHKQGTVATIADAMRNDSTFKDGQPSVSQVFLVDLDQQDAEEDCRRDDVDATTRTPRVGTSPTLFRSFPLFSVKESNCLSTDSLPVFTSNETLSIGDCRLPGGWNSVMNPVAEGEHQLDANATTSSFASPNAVGPDKGEVNGRNSLGADTNLSLSKELMHFV